MNKTELVTPEGQAFSDYVESINANPYPYETEDYARYEKAMAEMGEKS